jgi:hypothetical protein
MPSLLPHVTFTNLGRLDFSHREHEGAVKAFMTERLPTASSISVTPVYTLMYVFKVQLNYEFNF